MGTRLPSAAAHRRAAACPVVSGRGQAVSEEQERADGRSRRASHTPPVERLGSESGGSRVRDRGRGREHVRAEGRRRASEKSRGGVSPHGDDHPVSGPW